MLCSTSSQITFNQIPLASFHGHAGAIQKILIVDNENSFITASHDKTLKLWSVKTSEDRVTDQWTYKNHSRPVLDVAFVPARSQVVSTDCSVHIWDPFRGSAIRQLEWAREGHENAAVSILRTVNYTDVAAASNCENIVRLVLVGERCRLMSLLGS